MRGIRKEEDMSDMANEVCALLRIAESALRVVVDLTVLEESINRIFENAQFNPAVVVLQLNKIEKEVRSHGSQDSTR